MTWFIVEQLNVLVWKADRGADPSFIKLKSPSLSYQRAKPDYQDNQIGLFFPQRVIYSYLRN